MKKNGFTLAEVLITLAIIGVVATLTLPALMTNTAEQQAKTALKKGINTLTEAGQMNQAIAGFDYASLTSTAEGDNEQSLIGLLRSRANVDLRISGNSSTEATRVNAGASNYIVFFRDGSALSFAPDNTLMGSGKVGTMQNDGLVYGVTAVYDTNGAKGPNLLSNCSGTATMTNSGNHDSTEADHNAQCSRANRVIKDQFGVRLRGGYAFPNGAAARWAFEN